MLIRSSAVHLRAWADRLLAEPRLPELVRALPAQRLSSLIARVGLEDAGELVALCTPEQLARIWDDDLWSEGAPGEDAEFDAQRFATWLAVLVAESPALAAEKLEQVDFDVLCHGLAQLVWVVDVDALATELSERGPDDEAEQLEKVLGDGLHHELEQWRILSRHDDSWDAVLALLVELDQRSFSFLQRLLERLAELTVSAAEERGGLYEALTSAESLAEDVAASREERREEEGWVAPSSAKAVLALARVSRLEELVADRVLDPVTTRHVRVLARRPPRPLRTGAQAWAERILDAVEQEAPAAARSRSPRLRAGPGRGRLADALGRLAERDPALHALRVEEAAYAASVVSAGLGTRSARLRPAQAAEAAFRLCELGAGHVQRCAPARDLGELSLVLLLRVGFHLVCAEPVPSEVHDDPALMALRALATGADGGGAGRR